MSIIGNTELYSMRNFNNNDIQSMQKRTAEMNPAAADRGESKLYKVCQDFESIFIKQMLDVMRKTVHKTGLMDGGMAEDIFEDMLYEKYSEKMARNANFGLSDVMYRQLSGNSMQIS